MESTRCGRTRYLVVVSCTRKQAQRKLASSSSSSSSSTTTTTAPASAPISHQQQHFNNLITAQHVNSDKSQATNQSDISEYPTNNSAAPSPLRKSGAAVAMKPLINEKDLPNRNVINHVSQEQHQQQPNNLNEIEESCLLGIDCNAKTTVGLVVRILGDTTIRLDGDG